MSVESLIGYQLNKHPVLKKAIKRVYQKGMCAISHSFSSEGNIKRVSPNDGKEYFFGYYDKSPWDASGRYMLCMRAENTWSNVAPLTTADILLIDTESNNSVRVIATTHTWNVQQGCMAQWRGPCFDREIVFNDFRNGQYVCVILDVESLTEHVLPMPVYTVSTDGKTALSLDFSRLHRLRPGYGYANLPDLTLSEKIPDKTCVWKMDLDSGEILPVIKYTELAAFEPHSEMCDAEHKVNHLMLSPNGSRFMMLHRWFKGHRKYTRLLTCNIDGTGLYNLSDDDMVSHCCWKNDHEILAFENKRDCGTGYYLMHDQTEKYSRLWPELVGDGHPSYSPDGAFVVTDTYPNRKRIAEIRVMYGNIIQPMARVFAPFRYDNDTRCDLHPRWSRDGQKICFDAVFEGQRGLYTVDVPQRALSVAAPMLAPMENIKKQNSITIFYCDLIERFGNLYYCKSGLGCFLDEIASRYDYIFLCAPIKKILAISDLYKINAKNIVFQELPPFVGFIGAIKKSRRIKSTIKKYACNWNNPVYMRWPTPFVYDVFRVMQLKKEPMTVHIVGDVKAVVGNTDKYHGIKKMAAVLYAVYQESQIKRLIRCGVPTLVNGSGIRRLYAGNKYKNVKEIRSATMSVKDYDDTYIPYSQAANILYVGTLKSEKGLDYLIKALPIIIKQDIPVKLTIVGDGPMREPLESLSKELSVDKIVSFAGYIAFGSELKHFYRSNSIFVLPSISEGTPRVLIEAMANKLAVIATNVGGVPYTVSDMENGVLIEAKDSDAIAEAIIKLVNNEDLRKKLTENGYRFAKENTIEHFVDEVCTALSQEVVTWEK